MLVGLQVRGRRGEGEGGGGRGGEGGGEGGGGGGWSCAQTQPSHEERVWCHKPESLDLRKC